MTPATEPPYRLFANRRLDPLICGAPCPHGGRESTRSVALVADVALPTRVLGCNSGEGNRCWQHRGGS